jgi:lipoprotein-anchoring transpeptidase ErfK/SrfK
MFRTRRTTTAVAAAAGLGAVTAVATADEPAEPAADAGPAVDVAGVRGLAGRLAELSKVLRTQRASRERRRRGHYTILRVRRGRSVALRTRPGGSVAARARATTEFGSPQTLTVVERRGRWFGVTASQRPNGRLAWVQRDSSAFERERTRVSLQVDLSRKRLTLREGRTVRSVRVGVGGSLSPTPTGRFAVTDKLRGGRYSDAYGCCILALSGRQNRTPPGWRGGDRLAIHGSSAPGDFTGASAGCVRADARTLKTLMRRVPLGTPVFVKR